MTSECLQMACRHAVRTVAALVPMLWLAGCATLLAPPTPTATLFLDAGFAPPTEPADAGRIFALSPAMHRYLDEGISARARQAGPQRALVDALLKHGDLKLEYDAALTRNAAQAFEARAGNCLSLVVMTAAFAKELGLRVVYRQVDTGGVWDRNGDLTFSLGHVNVSLGPLLSQSRQLESRTPWLTIDFLPSRDAERARAVEIDEARIVSMVFNNRAVESLVAGRVDDAYWWSRAAVQADPQHADAYNTLGVIYQRHGDMAPAEAAWRAALRLPVPQPNAMGNLAALLDQQGRAADAAAVRVELRRIEPERPLRDYDEGLRALAAGQPAQARTLFERELRRGIEFHELHLNLARAYQLLGHTAQVALHLEKARETSTTREQQALYAAKLARLKDTSVH